MNHVIFQRLMDRAAAGGTVIANSEKGRYIKRFSEEDAELMAKADISFAQLLTRICELGVQA